LTYNLNLNCLDAKTCQQESKLLSSNDGFESHFKSCKPLHIWSRAVGVGLATLNFLHFWTLHPLSLGIFYPLTSIVALLLECGVWTMSYFSTLFSLFFFFCHPPPFLGIKTCWLTSISNSYEYFKCLAYHSKMAIFGSDRNTSVTWCQKVREQTHPYKNNIMFDKWL
jgi:hypothetical protein